MKAIFDSFAAIKSIKEIKVESKNENKVVNIIGDVGCKSILNSAKYFSNLEKLDLRSNRI